MRRLTDLRGSLARSCVAVLSLGLAACESSPEIPTALDGPPPFSRIVFDRTTLSPPPGTVLSVGQSIGYEAEAFYELAEDDYRADSWKSASLLLESWLGEDVDDAFGFSRGDWVEHWTALEEGATSGTIARSGTLTVPAHSPDCERYDEIHITATLGDDEQPPGVGAVRALVTDRPLPLGRRPGSFLSAEDGLELARSVRRLLGGRAPSWASGMALYRVER